MSTKHPWQFVARFRRNAFGWKSAPAIQRLKEAVTEIRSVARKDVVLGGEGALLLLEKLSPAIEHVDGSSGAMGNAVNKAIDSLKPLLVQAPWTLKERRPRMERLWEAIEDDGICYIESLADQWGELCVYPELALEWVAAFQPMVNRLWSSPASGAGYSKGIPACLSCLHAAGMDEELLTLLEKAPISWWHYRQWGVNALLAMGRATEALQYAQATDPGQLDAADVARACEDILLSMGQVDEAYKRYALQSHRGMTHLATYRALVRRYPSIKPETILRDLVAASPGQSGKWFAAAKDAGFLELALQLAHVGPTDPKTLNRAAKDFMQQRPDFALQVSLLCLLAIARGDGYEVTELDVWEAARCAKSAAQVLGLPQHELNDRIQEVLPQEAVALKFVNEALARGASQRY